MGQRNMELPLSYGVSSNKKKSVFEEIQTCCVQEVESMAMRVYRSAFGRVHFSTFRGCFWRNSTGNGRKLFFPEPIFSSRSLFVRFCTKAVQGQDQGLQNLPYFFAQPLYNYRD
jgi:hypothetical protein